MNTIYLVTYAIFQIPSTSLLTIAPPKYVFVAANVSWSVLTLITFRMQHVYQIFILNAFEGAFSAVAYVGAHFIYGSWYKKSELSTRAAIFCCFGHLGSMAGGWIQAGLLATANGKGGLPAWRWIFIIVSVITVPVAIFGECQLPGSEKPRPAWVFLLTFLCSGFRLVRDSESPGPQKCVVPEQERAGPGYQQTGQSQDTDMGPECLPPRPAQLAVLHAALHFHALLSLRAVPSEQRHGSLDEITRILCHPTEQLPHSHLRHGYHWHCFLLPRLRQDPVPLAAFLGHCPHVRRGARYSSRKQRRRCPFLRLLPPRYHLRSTSPLVFVDGRCHGA